MEKYFQQRYGTTGPSATSFGEGDMEDDDISQQGLLPSTKYSFTNYERNKIQV